jgi:hypothetical protein
MHELVLPVLAAGAQLAGQAPALLPEIGGERRIAPDPAIEKLTFVGGTIGSV